MFVFIRQGSALRLRLQLGKKLGIELHIITEFIITFCKYAMCQFRRTNLKIRKKKGNFLELMAE